MGEFTRRREAFERKFAHDEALRFKATARRNKLLGLWAAPQLGKSGAEAEAYADTVVMAEFEEAGDDESFGRSSTTSMRQAPRQTMARCDASWTS
jgi:hypothetical protein